jgi:hypothetical protein
LERNNAGSGPRVAGAIFHEDRKRKSVYFNRKCIAWLPETKAVAFCAFQEENSPGERKRLFFIGQNAVFLRNLFGFMSLTIFAQIIFRCWIGKQDSDRSEIFVLVSI